MPTLKLFIDDILISEHSLSDTAAAQEIEVLKSKIARYEEAVQLASHAVDSLESRVSTLTQLLEDEVEDPKKGT